jgi:phosphoglycolate phosphatase
MAWPASAGVTAIGVSWGYHPVEALRQAGAGAIVESYGALRAHLLDWLDRVAG